MGLHALKIKLGVVDQPYGYGNLDATTHDVAEILEARYGLFTHFWEQHESLIRREVGESIAYSLINTIKYGAPLVVNEQLANTMREFNLFLEREEMAGLDVDGVPTEAALRGKNSRLKKKFGPRRPSFIDGGLFKASFVAWIDSDEP